MSTTTPADVPLRSQWTALYGRLIQDVADYREAWANYMRSGDTEGARRADAKAAAVTKVMDYMDELERAAMITTHGGKPADARENAR